MGMLLRQYHDKAKAEAPVEEAPAGEAEAVEEKPKARRTPAKPKPDTED